MSCQHFERELLDRWTILSNKKNIPAFGKRQYDNVVGRGPNKIVAIGLTRAVVAHLSTVGVGFWLITDAERCAKHLPLVSGKAHESETSAGEIISDS